MYKATSEVRALNVTAAWVQAEMGDASTVVCSMGTLIESLRMNVMHPDGFKTNAHAWPRLAMHCVAECRRLGLNQVPNVKDPSRCSTTLGAASPADSWRPA